VYVYRHFYFDRHQFRRLTLAVEENDFFTVAQCSQGVLCSVQERPKIISNFELKKMTPKCNALAKLIISYL